MFSLGNFALFHKIPRPVGFGVSLVFLFFIFMFMSLSLGLFVCFFVFSTINYFGNKISNENIPKQNGKIIIITGVAENGIGYYLAKELLEIGATVVLGCRNVTKTEELVKKLKSETKNQNLFFIKLDVSSIESVKEFVREFKSKFNQLDVLMNNAGSNSKKGERSAEGYEYCVAINYIGLFSLTFELLDLLKNSNGRIVNTSSIANASAKSADFDDWKGQVIDGSHQGYARGKLYVNMFNKELQKRLLKESSKVKTFAFHPGAVATALYGKVIPIPFLAKILDIWFSIRMMTPMQGAATGVYLAASDNVSDFGGKYLFKKELLNENPLVEDEETTNKLWELTEELYKKHFQ
jgi:NAD(P)-dependent dehydrogenase (short-subunit alcohol dehydrogenase family)